MDGVGKVGGGERERSWQKRKKKKGWVHNRMYRNVCIFCLNNRDNINQLKVGSDCLRLLCLGAGIFRVIQI